MESFYGGRPGASFIIVKTFQTMDAMKQAFQQGTGYNQVYFDEYVTIYKTSDPAYKYNGNVYRRGYDINNGLGGAQYVGNITGPAGPATLVEPYPHEKIVRGGDITQNMSLFTNDANDIANNNPNTYNMVNFYNGKDAFEIVPGAEKINDTYTNFIDNIFFRYYFVMDEQNRNQIMRIGFKIPYPVFNFQVEKINADEQPWIIETDAGDHKFFHSWKVGLPIAVKGDCVTRFSLLAVQTIDGIPNNSRINYSFYAPTTEDQQAKRALDLENKQNILVCDIVKYNKKGQELPPETYYVCDFNIIKNIDIDTQGYLIFTLPDGSQINSSVSILPKINDLHLNEYGEMSIDWTNTDNSSGVSTLENEVKWIHDIDFDDDGGLVLTWNTKKRNNEGEIELNADNTPKRDSKLLTMSKGQRFITDLQIHNGIIYETYAGLRKEMCDLFNEADVNNAEGSGAQNIYNDAVNNPNGALYWWNTSNLTWYKQLFNIDTIVKSLVEEKINATFPDIVKYYSKGTSIDNLIVNAELQFNFSTTAPWAYTVSMEIELPEKLSSSISIIRTKSQARQELNSGIYNKNIIQRIYLQELDSEQLQYIYPQIPEDIAQTVWQNVGYNLFTTTDPCLDPWALSYYSNENLTWEEGISNQYASNKPLNYDYRFYSGQKFLYTSDGGENTNNNHYAYYQKSTAATKAIFGFGAKRYHSLNSGAVITPGANYFNIENVTQLYNSWKNGNYSSYTEPGYHYPSFWAGNDRVYVWEGGNNVNDGYTYNESGGYHFQIQRSLPYYAAALFNEILTGKKFTIPGDGTEISSSMKTMIQKLTNWNFSQKDGKLLCYGPSIGGTSYSQMAGKVIKVPVTVELANLNF